jgi:hypothetical protein
MSVFSSYLTSLVVTLIAAILITLLLRNSLRHILMDLCRTEARAQFWTLFSMVMLIGMPMVIGMGYTPEASSGSSLFFEMARQVRGNLLGYLFMLAVVGGFICLFALFAPRPKAEDL